MGLDVPLPVRGPRDPGRSRRGQPLIEWTATIRDRDRGRMVEVAGHVEVRWSHGRFKGAPEAKVYLDTPHALVPGYQPLV